MNAETKIHLFVGPASSGKTRLANEILAAVPHCFPISISGRHNYLFEDPFLYESATTKTKLILIDDFLSNKKNFVGLKCLALTDPLSVNQKHQWGFKINPIFIVTMDPVLFISESFNKLPKNIQVHKFPLSYLEAANIKENIISNLK